MAADPGHLVGIVEPALAGGVDARGTGDPQRQQAGPQHVLHGLAQAQIDGEGERGQHFTAAGSSRRLLHSCHSR